MKISNEIKSRFIELSVVEAVKEHYPTYRIEISLETENIKSSFSNYIWISEEDIDTFILGLENLDETRDGQAELNSMSPEELRLLFKNYRQYGSSCGRTENQKRGPNFQGLLLRYKHRVSGRPNYTTFNNQRLEKN